MNLKKTSLAALVLSLIAIGAFLAINAYHKDAPQSELDVQQGADARAADASSNQAGSLSALIKQKKLDPRYVQPQGTKAFAISRTGEFRPEGNAKDYITSLLSASDAGDSTATFNIYLAALDCRNAGSPSEIQSATRLPDERTQHAALESSDRRLGECESLLIDPALSASGKWLLRAAQQGSIEAMLLYTTDTESAFGGSANAIRDPDLVADWKRNSVLFLDTAVRNGSVDALVKLATANNNGIIVERNPTEAYAYYLAAHRAMPQATSEKLLGRYREELNSSQQQDAIRRADAIYKNCCQ